MMLHPLAVKCADATSVGLLIPSISLGVGTGASVYGALVSKSKDLGKATYNVVSRVGVDEPPSQKTVDAILAKKIMEMDAEALKDLQADIIVQHLASKGKGKKRG